MRVYVTVMSTSPARLTTPAAISSQVRAFCASISGNAPVFVEVVVEADAEAADCFVNAANVVNQRAS